MNPNTKIAELVGENYVYASVLHYFGIQFYRYSDKTLQQVCAQKGICVDKLVAGLESAVAAETLDELSLMKYPIDLVVEYLKHAHHIFIKRKLPYLASLIDHLPSRTGAYQTVIRDLKFVFPLFVEEFIQHIYQEEDNLFGYIALLDQVIKNNYNPSILYYEMEKYSIQHHAIEHEVHDDEMEGIRNITKNYKIKARAPLHVKVVYSELKAFEESLVTHARIEDEILFPKALVLERQVKTIFEQKIREN